VRPFAVPDDLRKFIADDSVPEETARLHIASASGAVRSFCQWGVSAGVTEGLRLRSVTGARSLWLPTLHLRAVTLLADAAGTPLVYPQDYSWETHGRINIARWTRTFGPQAGVFVVSYADGYPDDHPVIDHVRGIVLAAAARLLENPTALRSWTTGAESATAAGGGGDVVSILAREERTQLESLRLPVLA
jgi:hypothetical protein